MTSPNFFCDIAAMDCIHKMEFSGEYKDIDLTMDLIEIPYFFIYSSDAENYYFKAIERGEMYTHSEKGGIESAHLTVNKTTNEGMGTASEDLQKFIGAIFEVCKSISFYIQDNGLEQVYEGFDPEQKGIRLIANGDKLEYKVVEGKKRPDLMCSTLFGGKAMCRPYMEDFMENSEREMMSLEEKIEAAESGDAGCMDDLMMLYLDGDEETDANPEKAVYWARKLAETGDSNGMFNLGLFYAKGYGVKRDFGQAIDWMKKAEAAGDGDATDTLKLFQLMIENLPKAEAGDAEAQAVLAKGYMSLSTSLDQAGPDKDYAECIKWAKKSAEMNNGNGLSVLALAYEHGRGVPIDIEKAIECYQKGAEMGDAFCQHNLGCKYIAGEQVPLDKKKGFELIKKSAEQGHGPGMRDLGKCYQFGEGCMGNMKTAVEWYEKALEVIDDPELAQKTALFKTLSSVDEHWDEDYEGVPIEEEAKEEKQVEEDALRARQLAEQQKKQAIMEAERKREDAILQARNQFEKNVTSVLTEKADCEKRKKEAETILAGLGIFKRAEKKQQSGIIETMDKAIADLEQKIDDLLREYEKTIRITYDSFCTEDESSNGHNAVGKTEGHPMLEKNKKIILKHMVSGKRYSVTDLFEQLPFGADVTSQMVSAAVRQLREEGFLVRTEEKRRAYFHLAPEDEADETKIYSLEALRRAKEERAIAEKIIEGKMRNDHDMP